MLKTLISAAKAAVRIVAEPATRIATKPVEAAKAIAGGGVAGVSYYLIQTAGDVLDMLQRGETADLESAAVQAAVSASVDLLTPIFEAAAAAAVSALAIYWAPKNAVA
ncbi:MAG: hypothetical protein AAGI34_08385 [Pseudomonadota bacterium]